MWEGDLYIKIVVVTAVDICGEVVKVPVRPLKLCVEGVDKAVFTVDKKWVSRGALIKIDPPFI